MSEIDAVVLAGGRSRRMGRDKALLPFGGYETLAEYQYRRLSPYFERVWLSAKSDKFPFDAPLILDEGEIYSPMIALRSILGHTAAEAVFVLGVDLPFVSIDLIQKLTALYRQSHGDIIIVESPKGFQPLCAIYKTEIEEIVVSMINADEHRMGRLYEREELEVVTLFCRQETQFHNLNEPGDLTAALKRIR